MNSITQDINFKQSVIKYSYKHGVTVNKEDSENIIELNGMNSKLIVIEY